ncbi:hypothetical protein CRBSH125_04130 [Afipia carboxidovorans]|nr:hypothetical protein CRBSH125_04130 [Afipia carboxidovorans]
MVPLSMAAKADAKAQAIPISAAVELPLPIKSANAGLSGAEAGMRRPIST